MFDLGNRKFLEFHVLPLMDKVVSRYPAWLLAFHFQCYGHLWEHEALFCSSAPYICQGCHEPCRIPLSIHHFDDSPDGAQVLWHQVVRLEGAQKVFPNLPWLVSRLCITSYQVGIPSDSLNIEQWCMSLYLYIRPLFEDTFSSSMVPSALEINECLHYLPSSFGF